MQNEYIKAIESLGNVLSSYDWGKRIPAFGFGAKTLSMSPSYCFPLDEKDPEPSDVQVNEVPISADKYIAPTKLIMDVKPEKKNANNRKDHTKLNRCRRKDCQL